MSHYTIPGNRARIAAVALEGIIKGVIPCVAKTRPVQRPVISSDHACCETGEHYTVNEPIETMDAAQQRTAWEYADKMLASQP